MDTKPTYEELVQKVKKLEKELIELKAIRMHADPTKDTAGNGIRSDTTGFKEVERIEQNTDNLYRQLIDLYNSPIHVYDRESRLILMNRKTAEIIGDKPESLIGKKLTEIFVSPMAEDLVKTNRNIIETGQPADYEIPIEFFGKKRWYWSHAQPIKDKDGNSILMVISYDITERKNAEEKLRRREYLLNQAQKLAHLGSYELDININDYERSDELFRIFGLNRDEVDSREDIIKRIHPDDREYVEKQLKLLLAGNRVGLVEFRIIRPDGEERIVSANAEIIIDDSGIPIKIIGYFIDTTERKKTEEKLLRREALLNQTQRLAHLGSYEFDMISNKFERSDEIYRIFGITRYEVVSNERIIKTIHPDDRDYIEQQFKLSLTGNHEGPVEFRIIRPDGEERVASANSEVILDNNGMPVKFIGYVQDITERKRAEKVIRQSEILLKQTQKLAHIGSYEFDMSRNRFERSDELFRILGINQDEVNPEERIIKCVHPDDTNHLDKLFQLLESGHKIGAFEFRIIRPDGEERVVSANAEITFDDSGVPIKRTGYLLDITERKKAEEELRQSEYLLNQAQQLSHLGSYEYDIKTNRFKRSNELFRILGINRDEVNAEKRIFKCIHPDDSSNVEKQFNLALTGNSTDLFEFRIIRPDGEERIVSANAKTILDDSGVPSKMIGSVLDITERKLAEDELRQNESMLNQAQQLAHLGSYEYDIINNRYLRSDEIFRIFGISRNEVNPEDNLTRWIHPDDRSFVENNYQLLYEGISCERVEFRIVRPDGEERFISAITDVSFDNKGAPVKIVGCILDITESKKAEEELRQKQYLLEQAQRLAHLGSYEWDIINKRYDRSDELFRIFGLTRDKVAPDETLFKWVHPDDKNFIEKGYKDTMSGLSTGAKKFRIIRPDGEERYLLSDEEVMLDDRGTPIRSIGSVLDITEHKKIEEKLRQSKNLLDQAQQLAHLGSYEYDIRTNRFERSDELFRIFGLTRDKVAPDETLFKWVHPDDKNFI
ncbi:MAG: PAS domain S-box protein, partial [Desulfobacterium sp.]|nr:PAS domain S-box protein [Desulfobacterium sp.]